VSKTRDVAFLSQSPSPYRYSMLDLPRVLWFSKRLLISRNVLRHCSTSLIIFPDVSRWFSRYVWSFHLRDHIAICFTICLFISPDLDGHRAPTICFTICLFISPDLDGYRAPKNGSQKWMAESDLRFDMFFTICLFISPDFQTL